MKKTSLTLLAFLAITLASQAQWVIQNTGFTTQYRGISFISIVNSNVVWATAYDGSGNGAIINEFTRTTDGGVHWTPGQVLGGSTYGLGNISAINADTAWVALYKGSGNQDNTCGVYRTNDGGVTWTHQPTALVGSASFADNVHFWNANEGMAHGDVRDGYFEIYWTSDGGASWTRVPQADINATVASGEGGWTSVIDAVGDSMVCFGTNKGNIYISNDRGHHWFQKATGIVPVNSSGGVNQIAFLDPLHGMVAQGNNPGQANDTTFKMYKTSDGGQTWALAPTTGWVFSSSLAAVKGSASTYVTAGANFGSTNDPHYIGSSYSFDGSSFTDFPGTLGLGDAGSQFLYTSFINDSTGWSGHFNQDATTDGIWKFDGVLALPVANFVASDTAVALGTLITFTNLSTGGPTSYLWTFEGGSPATSTAKNPVPIQYNTPGSYNVTLKVTSSFGNNTLLKSDYIYVGGVGIDDISSVSITMYPNPAHDFLRLSSSQTIQSIQVYNMVGQTVIDRKVDSKEYTVGVADLNNGVYTMKLTINDKPYIRKIVVN